MEPHLEFKGVVADLGAAVAYRRCRFMTELPKTYRYTASHLWLVPMGEPKLWRVGFTKFAVRMLGDFVELQTHLRTGERLQLGQEMGSYEGLKAVTTLYSVMEGVFLRANPALERDGELAEADPYVAGWLYEARGTPDPAQLDVFGYIGALDAIIDKLAAKNNEE
jgi:glycine cleavage system H protein